MIALRGASVATGLMFCMLCTLNISGQVMPTPGTHQDANATSASASQTTGSATSSLTPDEVDKILQQAESASSRTVSLAGLRTMPGAKRACREIIYVVDRSGKVLGHREMPDAWTGSIDIALGKARTAAFFSSDENALTSRHVGQLSQPHGPDGTGAAGPLWGINDTNSGAGQTTPDMQRNGIVVFPGGVPLYKGGHLVGGLGVSGDGVDQDESIAFAGAQGFMPPGTVGKVATFAAKPVDWIDPPEKPKRH